jgi:hypothetical protein
MALGHSPQTVTNGLVFYYDMGNPQKSWKGAPTTNIVSNWNLDTGWSKNYCTDIIFNEIPPPYGITAPTVGFKDVDGNGSGYWYSYGNFASGQTPGSIMTVSMYVKVAGPTCTLRCYTADNSETGRVFGSAITVSESEGWKRCIWTITIPNPSVSESLSFEFSSIPATSRMWLCAPQMETGSFATPFVAGTRSNTLAVLDLTNNNTITATSLTYANDGTFSFNGSTDYLTIPNTTLGNGNIPWTISCWMKTTTTTNSLGQGSVISNISGGPVYSMLGVNNGKIVYWTYQSSAWTQKLGVGKTVNDGNWHMLTWVNYSNSTMDMYVDGLLDSNVANSTSGNNNPVDVIGRSWAGYFPGSISTLTRYDRSLTASEVQQNFHAFRGRFGI